jgi:gas vesicle protein
MITADTQPRPRHGFLTGLLTGSIVVAGLAIIFAPRAERLRKRIARAADAAAARARDGYQQVSARMDDAVADLTAQGENARNEMVDAVARGAHHVGRSAAEVERRAMAAKS